MDNWSISRGSECAERADSKQEGMFSFVSKNQDRLFGAYIA
jgi:hypothetical protein